MPSHCASESAEPAAAVNPATFWKSPSEIPVSAAPLGLGVAVADGEGPAEGDTSDIGAGSSSSLRGW
jgi:hypothetical protein